MEKDSNTVAQGLSDDQMHWNLECEMLSGNVMMICQVTILYNLCCSKITWRKVVQCSELTCVSKLVHASILQRNQTPNFVYSQRLLSVILMHKTKIVKLIIKFLS